MDWFTSVPWHTIGQRLFASRLDQATTPSTICWAAAMIISLGLLTLVTLLRYWASWKIGLISVLSTLGLVAILAWFAGMITWISLTDYYYFSPRSTQTVIDLPVVGLLHYNQLHHWLSVAAPAPFYVVLSLLGLLILFLGTSQPHQLKTARHLGPTLPETSH